MNYYNEIKEKLIDNEIYAKVKDYSKEQNRVKTYFEIGKLLSEAGSKYGESIINEFSKKLTTMLSKLTWSYYLLLLPFNDNNKIYYYIKITEEHNLDVRLLKKKILSNEYERLDEKTKEKLINQE